MSGAQALITYGFEKMKEYTNKLKMKSVETDPEKSILRVNQYGEIDAFGNRGNGPNFEIGKHYNSKLAELGMDLEGLELSEIESPINRSLNWVSKTHDFFNSWHYNTDNGFFQPFTNSFFGKIGAELFEVYSFVGMPIAGAYTAVAKFGDRAILANNIQRNFR